MGNPEFISTLIAFLSMGMVVTLLVFFELRAQWKQREDLNRLLILALFRMSKRQISTTEEQTRRIDALLDELRARRRLDPAVLAEVRREVDAAAGDEAASDEAAEGEEERGARRGRRIE